MNFFFQADSVLFNFFTGVFLALIISFISYRLKILTASGILAAFILALVIFTFGTWKWTIPIVTFFILSSLLSKHRKSRNETVELFFEKSGERDYMQVIANGGLASILVVLNFFFSSELLYIVYVSMIASVCADTWATEIGTLAEAKTINILTFKKVEQGVSGGISLPGTIGAICGAMVIAITSLPWLESNYLMVSSVIAIAGFSGSIADSIFGAAFQSQYKCGICSKVTERKIHCGKETELFRGISWINNDTVNIGSGISGGIFSLILFDVVKV